MRSSIVGTTVAEVTPSASTRRTHSRASKLVRYTIFRPAYRFDMRRRQAGDVVRRHADQRGVTRIGGVELHRAGDVAGEVVVGQLDGFRRRRGAGGEQHHRHRVGVGELGGGLGGLAPPR